MSCRILNPSPSTLLHHRPHLSPIRNPNLRSAPRNSFYLSPFLPSNSPQTILSRNLNRVQKRCNSSLDVCSLELPLLPFESNEVLVPSEIKTLHLYEAKLLALLEEALVKTKKLFVHFLLQPVHVVGPSAGASFAAKYGCLVVIENVEKLEIGALVSIRGICRVRITEFVQAEPYLKGVVVPLQDDITDPVSNINFKVMELKEVLNSFHSLEIKLKAPKHELLQTPIINSLRWTEKEISVECDEAFVPPVAELISFVAFQPVSGSTPSELLALRTEKLLAMNIKDTLQRLENSIKLVKRNISVVAAKLAIQSLDV